jgi:hypothetical protein
MSLCFAKQQSPLSHFFILISLSCVFLFPGPNVIKLFTAVIYCHSMAIPLLCVIKQHYFGNYCRMAVNYLGICVTNVIKHNLTLNGRNILHHFNPRKSPLTQGPVLCCVFLFTVLLRLVTLAKLFRKIAVISHVALPKYRQLSLDT